MAAQRGAGDHPRDEASEQDVEVQVASEPDQAEDEDDRDPHISWLLDSRFRSSADQPFQTAPIENNSSSSTTTGGAIRGGSAVTVADANAALRTIKKKEDVST
jgi:hypothetical protein